MPKLAYVKHPITTEQKKALRGDGFKIIDARFAPEGAEIIDLSEGEEIKIPESPEDIDGLKKAELEELLKRHGVENLKGKVDELKAALKQVMFVDD
ncbi:hypothetical protein [uncultured Ruegeria sp.]|uniref:hypothetical protein n=1 Tax=uncultured Ruegeria sp. TaxID=259304 RepID=UPI002606D1AC|nr:hypothetical protein [uncultured Ruegeria sp.]